MRQAAESRILALAVRASVLLGLIARAAWLYARLRLSSRGVRRLSTSERDARLHAFAARFVAAATRFRGGLIKLGQVASLRLEVLPEAITHELAHLQDRVAPHPFTEIAARIEHEYGVPWNERLSDLAREPIAAASLGQVHEARTRDGRRLALKVLYPGIERSVAVDLAMAKLALWLFDFVAVPDLLEVYRQLRASLRGEMDYQREGRAAEEIAHNLARDAGLWSHLRVPRIHWDLTTRRVLAMEFIDGVKINDVAAVAGQGVSREDLVAWASRAFLHMMFRDGFFHCDPHPGNLIVDGAGRIAIIDFGMNERLDAGVLAAVRDHLRASVLRDRELFATSLVAAGAIDASDLPIAREIAELAFDPTLYNLTPQEVAGLDFTRHFVRLRGQMVRLRSFRLPPGVVMWSRAISILYGLVVELAPGLRPLDLFGPYVMEFLAPPQPERVRSAAP
jgi:predicted unusual protein kinase regulating ubiquinone biosynthesis (AarF/ABC1/UbiB family)